MTLFTVSLGLSIRQSNSHSATNLGCGTTHCSNRLVGVSPSHHRIPVSWGHTMSLACTKYNLSGVKNVDPWAVTSAARGEPTRPQTATGCGQDLRQHVLHFITHVRQQSGTSSLVTGTLDLGDPRPKLTGRLVKPHYTATVVKRATLETLNRTRRCQDSGKNVLHVI